MATEEKDKPDLAKRPDFEAVEKYITDNTVPETAAKLLKWADRLKAWVEHAMIVVEDHEETLEDKKKEYEAAIDDMQANAKEWEDRAGYVDGMLEIIADMDRGIMDWTDMDRYIDAIPEAEKGVK